MQKASRMVTALAGVLLWSAAAVAQQPATALPGLEEIREYIAKGWAPLTRAMNRCETVRDARTGEQSVLYLPAGYALPEQVKNLQQECRLEVRHLPRPIVKLGDLPVEGIEEHGLLYLENSYVVPGGFFNEMYGWDSYFIIRGLLRDGELQLARDMVENFFFQIEHYGAVLNANRTYFLSRSQPPFLTSMVMAVFEADKEKQGREDLEWLRRAYGYAVKDYEMWTTAPKLAGSTGLSRYFDVGQGPAPEVLIGTDRFYAYATQYFLRNPQGSDKYLEAGEKLPAGWPVFTVQMCEGRAAPAGGKNCQAVRTLGPNAHFYKGDRSMRESGFDISSRFGPFSADTHEYAAVCLNSLLFKAEMDLEHMSLLLRRPQDASRWRQQAKQRAARMSRHFWDAKQGMFFDFNTATNTRSDYVFLSTFYPLWVGAATEAQARAVMKNLKRFEQAGGLAMSTQETRAQWDYPYGWAPVHLIAIEGMRRYGFDADADRVSQKFLTMVIENFQRDRTIREKYNVVTRSTETNVEAGYAENVVGFGWTNGVFLELLHAMNREAEAPAKAAR